MGKVSAGGERRFAAKHLHGAEPAAERCRSVRFLPLLPGRLERGVYFGSETLTSTRWRRLRHLEMEIQDGRRRSRLACNLRWQLVCRKLGQLFLCSGCQQRKEMWRFKTGEILTSISGRHPVLRSGGDRVVTSVCRDSKFYAVDAATGKERWSFFEKGFVGHFFPRHRWMAKFISQLRIRACSCFRCRPALRLFSVDFTALADVLFAGDCRRDPVHWLASGQAQRRRPQDKKVAWTFEPNDSKKNGPNPH